MKYNLNSNTRKSDNLVDSKLLTQALWFSVWVSAFLCLSVLYFVPELIVGGLK